MNAHEFDYEHVPHLELSEIEEFKYLAQAEGVSRLADFPHLQPTSKPVFFTVNFDAEMIARRWPFMPHGDNELVIHLGIEFNELMVDEDGGIISSAVGVDVDSVVGDLYGGPIVEKQVRYLLSLNPDEPSTATEFRSDDVNDAEPVIGTSHHTDEELLDYLKAIGDKRRPLTYDDVQLLRYLISQP